MKFPRASGILMHPTSLPGEFGIGDFGREALRFIDFLEAAGQTYWQILPLGPTGFGDSPYQSFSAFAGNTLMISPEKMIEDALISDADLADKPDFLDDRVNFGDVYNWKTELLPRAYEEFNRSANLDFRAKYETFCRNNSFWLDDYALYRAIKISEGQKPWYQWTDELKLRDETALATAREQLFEQVRAQKFYQFIFFRQWAEVKEYANERGVRIIGDIPIFAALDSADVWCNQDEFKLNPDGSAKSVAGVPPDFFSKTGQLWGNPIYDWEAMRATEFRWWAARVYWTLQTVDIVRIDHFRGFAASWEVPGEDETAENGQWVDVPGKELFATLERAIGELPVIAEDLGVVTPDVEELRDGFGFPGMRILQFAFGGDPNNLDLPHNYIRNCVAYTGTHDNDTSVGWFQARTAAASARSAKETGPVEDFCLKYLDTDGEEIHWDMIRSVMASVADTAIVPMQDVLGLGNDARMNLPASKSGNWNWRMDDEAVTDEITSRLKELTTIYGREAHKQADD